MIEIQNTCFAIDKITYWTFFKDHEEYVLCLHILGKTEPLKFYLGKEEKEEIDSILRYKVK